jgi:hypothetical protein
VKKCEEALQRAREQSGTVQFLLEWIYDTDTIDALSGDVF